MPSVSTRREFLESAGRAALAASTPSLQLSPTGAGDEIARRAARVIREYDAQGWHRTGTRVDALAARWLAGLVRSAGLRPELQPFVLDRIEPRIGSLEAGGTRIAGLPAFDGTWTGAAGVRGRLGPAGTGAEIALFEAPPSGPAEALQQARRAARHRAVVVVTAGRRPGLAPRNAESFAAPFGPPVLYVASDAGPRLAELARAGAEVTLVAAVRRRRTRAFNVVARYTGRPGTTLGPVVVMTPRSGWWYCAGERGGGIACWLEAMRGVAAASPERPVEFVASSGHELGHLGLESYLALRPALAREAAAWVHFGASIGALEMNLALLASDDAIEELAAKALEGELGGMRTSASPRRIPRGTRPEGESRNIHDRGGRYVSLAGASGLFHLEADRWPAAVDVEIVAAYARAFTRVTLQLAGAAPSIRAAARSSDPAGQRGAPADNRPNRS